MTDFPILKYPVILEVENNFHLIYGQSYIPLEGDVTWKEINLPTDEIYKKFDDRARKISKKIMCSCIFNGTWISDTQKLFIHFNPSKYFWSFQNFNRFSSEKVTPQLSVKGLLNFSIPKFTIKTLSCEIIEVFHDTKQQQWNKIEKKILDYYKNRDFGVYSQKKRPYKFFPGQLQFQPVGDFIAQNYYNFKEYKKETKPIHLIDILNIVKDEQLYFSPVMSLKDEFDHCNVIYTQLREKIVDFPLYKQTLRELKQFVKQIMNNYQDNILTKHGPLNTVAWKAIQLGLNMSKLIFNYKQITSYDELVKEGMYVFFKSGTAIGIIHCLGFKDSAKIFDNRTVDVSKWKLYNNLWIISKTHCQKILSYSLDVSTIVQLDDKFKDDKVVYLVQIKLFSNDIIKVNTKHFPFINGSVRINCLAMLYTM